MQAIVADAARAVVNDAEAALSTYQVRRYRQTEVIGGQAPLPSSRKRYSEAGIDVVCTIYAVARSQRPEQFYASRNPARARAKSSADTACHNQEPSPTQPLTSGRRRRIRRSFA